MSRVPSEFASAFRRIRKAHGVSQKEVAEALGVNPRLISGFEMGWRKTISESHFPALARVLNATPTQMLVLRRARLMAIAESTFAQDLPKEELQGIKNIISRSTLVRRLVKR